jgi:hypothetical protein
LPGSKIRQEVVEAFNALRLRYPDLVPKRALSKEADSAWDVAVSAATVTAINKADQWVRNFAISSSTPPPANISAQNSATSAKAGRTRTRPPITSARP